VEAILRACFEEGAKNSSFNVAGPDVVTYRTVGRVTRIAIGAATREDLVPDHTRTWSRYVQQYDISKGKADLGFYPSIPIYEGLREIIEAAQADGDLPMPRSATGLKLSLIQSGQGEQRATRSRVPVSRQGR
jgi:nucleoside-diphosphate-sugar epimerase